MQMNFFEKLYELRKENGYSQEELADKLGVARQTISKWENGTTTPDTNNLIELSKIFKISIDELVGNELYKEKIEEKETKEPDEKIKKKEVKKIVWIITLLVIISITVTGCLIYGLEVSKRYDTLKDIFDNLANKYDSKEYNFKFYESVIEWKNGSHVNWERVDSYCKDGKMKKEYISYKSSLSKDEGSKLTRVEYWAHNYYYNIDYENKTYYKNEISVEPVMFYNSVARIIDGNILKTFPVKDDKDILHLAMDFSNKIDNFDGVDESNYNWLNVGDDYNFKRVSYCHTERWKTLSYDKYYTPENVYIDIDAISESYTLDTAGVSDEDMIFPDLTGFTEIK